MDGFFTIAHSADVLQSRQHFRGALWQGRQWRFSFHG
jgi:hypothetical protein